jgi:hypothetical protein
MAVTFLFLFSFALCFFSLVRGAVRGVDWGPNDNFPRDSGFIDADSMGEGRLEWPPNGVDSPISGSFLGPLEKNGEWMVIGELTREWASWGVMELPREIAGEVILKSEL